MTQQQPNFLELAKRGDPTAIATLMNRSLQSQGMSAKVARKQDRLFVAIEGSEVPDRILMTNFVRGGIENLNLAPSVKAIKIFGQVKGNEHPAWTQDIDLIPASAPATEIPDGDDEEPTALNPPSPRSAPVAPPPPPPRRMPPPPPPSVTFVEDEDSDSDVAEVDASAEMDQGVIALGGEDVPVDEEDLTTDLTLDESGDRLDPTQTDEQTIDEQTIDEQIIEFDSITDTRDNEDLSAALDEALALDQEASGDRSDDDLGQDFDPDADSPYPDISSADAALSDLLLHDARLASLAQTNEPDAPSEDENWDDATILPTPPAPDLEPEAILLDDELEPDADQSQDPEATVEADEIDPDQEILEHAEIEALAEGLDDLDSTDLENLDLDNINLELEGDDLTNTDDEVYIDDISLDTSEATFLGLDEEISLELDEESEFDPALENLVLEPDEDPALDLGEDGLLLLDEAESGLDDQISLDEEEDLGLEAEATDDSSEDDGLEDDSSEDDSSETEDVTLENSETEAAEATREDDEESSLDPDEDLNGSDESEQAEATTTLQPDAADRNGQDAPPAIAFDSDNGASAPSSSLAIASREPVSSEPESETRSTHASAVSNALLSVVLLVLGGSLAVLIGFPLYRSLMAGDSTGDPNASSTLDPTPVAMPGDNTGEDPTGMTPGDPATNPTGITCPTVSPDAAAAPLQLSNLQLMQSSDAVAIAGCLTNNTDTAIANVSIVYRKSVPDNPEEQIVMQPLSFNNLQPGLTVPFEAPVENIDISRAVLQSLLWAPAEATETQELNISEEVSR